MLGVGSRPWRNGIWTLIPGKLVPGSVMLSDSFVTTQASSGRGLSMFTNFPLRIV
jgi:hypothetical protein